MSVHSGAMFSSPISPTRRSAQNWPIAAQGFDYLVNAAGILFVKSIFEVTVRGLANGSNGQCRIRLLPLPADRLAPQSWGRCGQSLVEFGEARDLGRRRALCGVQDDDSVDHALFRLRSRRPSRCGSTRSVPASSIRRCRSGFSRAWRKSAGSPATEFDARAKEGGAARARRERCGMRRAHLVPVVGRSSLYDRTGDQFHRRTGQLVKGKGRSA